MGYDEFTPWEDLSKQARNKLLYGIRGEKVRVDYHTLDGRDTYWYIKWDGIVDAVQNRYAEASSDQARERLQQYFSIVPCETCGGKRLRPEMLAVTVEDKSIYEVCTLSARESCEFFEHLVFTDIARDGMQSGINADASILTALGISGALAGLGGAVQILGMGGRLAQLASQEGFGFEGITVALIGGSNPLGCIFAGIFYGAMKYGGSKLTMIKAPAEVVNIIMGCVIIFIAISSVFKGLFLSLAAKKDGKEGK